MQNKTNVIAGGLSIGFNWQFLKDFVNGHS